MKAKPLPKLRSGSVPIGTYRWLQRRAANYVIAAQFGAFPKLAVLRWSDVACVDCGSRATEYDHHDYRKPLKVDPVCKLCNIRRGRAKPYPKLSDCGRSPEVELSYRRRA